MIDTENLNMQLQKQFAEDKNYHSLERYVMSELLSPIEDYMNAMMPGSKHRFLYV